MLFFSRPAAANASLARNDAKLGQQPHELERRDEGQHQQQEQEQEGREERQGLQDDSEWELVTAADARPTAEQYFSPDGPPTTACHLGRLMVQRVRFCSTIIFVVLQRL